MCVLIHHNITFMFIFKCFLDYPFDQTKVFREMEDCNFCKNVTQVNRVNNMSPEEFEIQYILKTKPVVVTDGTRGWSAPDVFNFNFFKKLYETTNIENDDNECQFFPYKTEFKSLSEALNMSTDRSMLETGTKPWYIGWSNCNDNAGKILRQYYSTPYFLPKTSENIALNWIFMGGPGLGAHMHVGIL